MVRAICSAILCLFGSKSHCAQLNFTLLLFRITAWRSCFGTAKPSGQHFATRWLKFYTKESCVAPIIYEPRQNLHASCLYFNLLLLIKTRSKGLCDALKLHLWLLKMLNKIKIKLEKVAISTLLLFSLWGLKMMACTQPWLLAEYVLYTVMLLPLTCLLPYL